MIKAVVLTSARSGSNLLLSLLNSHPDFHFHGEVFNTERVNTFRSAQILTDLIGVDPTELRNRDPVKFVDTVYALSPTHLRTVGFKIFLNHDQNVIKRVLDEREIKIVCLDRSNRLASYSSKLIGEATGVWWVRNGDGAQPEAEDVKVRFVPENFTEYAEGLDRAYRSADERLAARGNFIKLNYSDLQSVGKMYALSAFLDAQKMFEMKPDLVKQNPDDLLGRFENPDEVVDHLEKMDRLYWLQTPEI